ncbi:MAG: molybdate ABC transporter substrate-binding protein [Gammaproteobacteria bacterium]|nr:molybdate ABC transporter substrate-binding protein [Gammaproteobacteria bacterium]
MRFSLMLLLLASAAQAGELSLAVATNFQPVATELAQHFDRLHGSTTTISAGSTGKLYAQIVNGAPYDVFLAADYDRPAKLVEDGLASHLHEYARGRLVLFSPLYEDCLAALGGAEFRHLSIANERLAPYGAAARDWLERQGIWQQVSRRIVRGENIGQAYLFVRTGNAELGMVALTQMQAGAPGCRYLVPENEHIPISQFAVTLDDSKVLAAAFIDFLQSAQARETIAKRGYTLPAGD